MTALVNGTITFVALLSLIIGLGCGINALNPRTRGAGFWADAVIAAAALTIAFGCALFLAGRLR